MRAGEIEEAQREHCARASRQLIAAYQQQVAKLQAALVRQLGEIGAAAQRNVQTELQAFMQLGLPAIQHILSDSSSLKGFDDDADAHAAKAARFASAESVGATAAVASMQSPVQRAPGDP